MLDLTDPEIRVLLWHIAVVERAYANEAPYQSTTDNVKRKLLTEVEETNGSEQR